MKNKWLILKGVLAIILSLTMIFALGACGSKGEEQPEIVYGNDEDIDTGDDDDTVIIESNTTTDDKGETDNKQSSGSNKGSGDKTTSANKGSGSKGDNKGGAIESYDDGLLKPNYTVNEDGKKDYLSSIPKNLSGKTVTILTWWEPLEYEVKKMEKFTKETGIKIKWISSTESEYMQRLSALKAQGSAPDLAAIRPQDYPGAILQDYFKPLTDGKLDLKNTALYDIDSMNMLKWDGKYYGALTKGTTRITMGLLMYNADLFKKYGVTTPNEMWQNSLKGNGDYNWDTFVTMAQQIQSKSGKTALTAGYQGYRLVQTVGEDAVKFSNGKLVSNMDSANYRKGYKWVTSLLMNGQHKIADWNLNRTKFVEGDVCMLVEETWALQKGERYENLSFSIGYAPLPCPTNKTVIPSDAQLWGFPVGSKNTEAASYAFEYWNNPEFDETGHSVWVNDSASAFVGWLWEQPKTFQISHGVVNYGGDYDFYTYNFEAASTSTENVDSVIDKWSGTIKKNIEKMYSEFGK